MLNLASSRVGTVLRGPALFLEQLGEAKRNILRDATVFEDMTVAKR